MRISHEGGLQIEQNGEWRDVPAKPGELVSSLERHGMDRGDCLFLAHHVRSKQEGSAMQRRFGEALDASAPVPQFAPDDILLVTGGTPRAFSALALGHLRRFAERMGYRVAAPPPVQEVVRKAWKPYWHKMFVLLRMLQVLLWRQRQPSAKVEVND